MNITWQSIQKDEKKKQDSQQTTKFTVIST